MSGTFALGWLRKTGITTCEYQKDKKCEKKANPGNKSRLRRLTRGEVHTPLAGLAKFISWLFVAISFSPDSARVLGRALPNSCDAIKQVCFSVANLFIDYSPGAFRKIDKLLQVPRCRF